MHKDSVKPGQKVVLVDDLIATGGTMQAAAELVEELGGEVVKMLSLLSLAGLNGRKLLASMMWTQLCHMMANRAVISE